MTPNQGHIAGLELALKEAQKAYQSTSGIAECRASGVFYKLEELISLAKSQPQSDCVIVPRELLIELRDAANECRNVTGRRHQADYFESLTKSADALLGGDQPAQPGSGKVGDFKSGD